MPTRDRIIQSTIWYVRVRGYPPSVRDIVDGCRLSSTSVANHHPDRLERDGRIMRDRGVARSIRVVEAVTDAQ